jgi:hypothetical protein
MGNKNAGKPKRRESDLYPPLKAWLEAGGYVVYAEVNSCDVAARKGDDLVLIEMKLGVNLDLLLQVVRRQEAHASVYAAVPAPDAADRRWRGLTRLLKRLEVGLILVHLDSALPRVELAFHPIVQERVRRRSATRALLAEMTGRSLDLNSGGANRRPLVTAYRERALTVAVALERLGPTSPKALRAAGAPDSTYTILRGNHYSWFERIDKGMYGLTDVGREGLREHGELVAVLRERLGAAGEGAT